MDDFQRELMRRSKLAAAVLEMTDFVFDDALVESIYADCRGRCYEGVLDFGSFLRLMRDALVQHGGSAHKLFVGLESRDAEPVDESNFYRKLARTPVQVSRALLGRCTQRLLQLMPGAAGALPCCFDGFEVIVGDGKKIKDAAKRLKLTRGYSGKLLGAKALVALDLRSGLAVAMSDSLDGLTNDVPLVGELMEQLHELYPRPILSVWDRQFDDERSLGRMSVREGDCFVVRARKTQGFVAESTVISYDPQGRKVSDEIGTLGKTAVRRVTLVRGDGEEDVALLTNLLDRARHPASDLLQLYKMRWGIEQMFQQVTETFSLSHLIGSSPRAVLLQFAFCLLLYNLMQVVKAYVADGGRVLASVVSMYYLFDDVRQELLTWAYHSDGSWPRTPRDAAALRGRLVELLGGVWNKKYTKASDKKPRAKPKPKIQLVGGHTSVQRLLEGRAKVFAEKK
jgi:hypothetical protein